jgi:hypothetical protein
MVKSKWVYATATALLLLANLVAPASALSISPQIVYLCDANRDSYVTWTASNKSWKITHVNIFNKNAPTQETITRTLSRERTLTASVTLDVGASIPLSNIIPGLAASVNLALKKEGSQTLTSSIQIESTLLEDGMYVFYRGNRHATGNFTEYICNPYGTGYIVNSSGSAKSFVASIDGVFLCSRSVTAGSIDAYVKAMYCL